MKEVDIVSRREGMTAAGGRDRNRPNPRQLFTRGSNADHHHPIFQHVGVGFGLLEVEKPGGDLIADPLRPGCDTQRYAAPAIWRLLKQSGNPVENDQTYDVWFTDDDFTLDELDEKRVTLGKMCQPDWEGADSPATGGAPGLGQETAPPSWMRGA
jgi:hypothetical protein